jgi:lipoate-protein ligase A
VNIEYVKKNGISVVRRVSGGSNIYTDEKQLTYSLVISKDKLPASREGSFAMICGALVLSLRRLGIDGVHKPVNDVLADGKKISGGAQARRGDAVLQHGSIILDVDDGIVSSSLIDTKKRSYAGLTSVKECLGYIPSRDVIAEAVMSGFSEVFGRVSRGELTEKELHEIKEAAGLVR